MVRKLVQMSKKLLNMTLNDNLFPNDSPIVVNQDPVNPFKFNYQNEAGIVSTVNIRNASIGSAQIGSAQIDSANINNFSFNQGTGGSITLGGTLNGNGVMRVLNSGGTEVVRADNAGVTITNGNLTLQNSGGTAIIDSSGLISGANFPFGNYFNTDSVFTTNETLTDISGGSLSFITTRGTTNVFISFSGEVTYGGGFSSTNYGGEIAIKIDGTVQDPKLTSTYEFSSPNSFVMTNILSYSGIYSLAAGTHNLVLQFACTDNSNDGNASVYNKSLLYMILGS